MERTVLYANEGMVLTNGEVFGKVVFLADGESAETYTEITDAEYLQMVESGSFGNEATKTDYQAALAEFGVKL
jgi:hypothetical protein